MANFSIRKGDRLPTIAATLYNDGVVVDLTGATIQFVYAPEAGGTATTRTAEIVSATAGTVQYQWVADDTDTAGTFRCYWKVTFPSAKVATYPNTSFLAFLVLDSLD